MVVNGTGPLPCLYTTRTAPHLRRSKTPRFNMSPNHHVKDNILMFWVWSITLIYTEVRPCLAQTLTQLVCSVYFIVHFSIRILPKNEDKVFRKKHFFIINVFVFYNKWYHSPLLMLFICWNMDQIDRNNSIESLFGGKGGGYLCYPPATFLIRFKTSS